MDRSTHSRITKLAARGVFKAPEIDSLGYGTFQPRLGPAPSKSVEKARALRAKVDAVLAKDRPEGLKMLLQIVMMYTKGYAEEAAASKPIDAIHRWKSLGKYVSSILGVLDKGEEDVAALLSQTLFNVKFHYLHLEGSLVARQGKKSGAADGVLMYFLNEYTSLHRLFAQAAHGLRVLDPAGIEDMIKEKINSM